MNISIITPTYNRSDCIERCLDSVTCQLATLPGDINVQHVVVDDGSADNTASMLTEYAKRNPHVAPVILPSNRGVNGARNEAIRKSSGDWVLFLDSDDALSSDAIYSIAEVVKGNPGYKHYMFTVDDRIEEMSQYGRQRIFTFGDFLEGRVTGDFSHFVDRNVLLDNPFDERLRIYEGVFFLRFYRQVGKMLFTNIVTHKRERNREDSVSLTCIRYNDEIIARRLMVAETMLEFFGEDFKACGREDIIESYNFEIADNALLLGDYGKARKYLAKSGNGGYKKILKMVGMMRLHRVYKLMLQWYLALKYRKPSRNVR